MTEDAKGRQKMRRRNYRRVAAAAWNAIDEGGGMVTMKKGVYEEEDTIKVRGEIRSKAFPPWVEAINHSDVKMQSSTLRL
eukprot:766031-Hanusia_phi.AAC.1